MEHITKFLNQIEMSLTISTADWDEERKREGERWFAQFRANAIALDDAFDIVTEPLREKARHDEGCRIELRMATLRMQSELLREVEVFVRHCGESLNKMFEVVKESVQ